MKVLSLSQPWAGLVFQQCDSILNKRAAKEWETRGWKPGEANQAIIRRDGLLIHASETWKPSQRDLLNKSPFNDYYKAKTDMVFGAILGMVTVAEIITTEKWIIHASQFEDGAAEKWWEEKQFGDYSENRFAWHFPTFTKFETPIPCKGKLSLWEYDLTERN